MIALRWPITRPRITIMKAPFRNGLRDISMDDWWKNPLAVVDAIHEKVKGLPVDLKKYPLLSREIPLVTNLLRAIGERRYGKISMLAVVDILLATHYFLELGDRNPDSREGGYTDDEAMMHQALTKHRAEVQEFEKWLRANG